MTLCHLLRIARHRAVRYVSTSYGNPQVDSRQEVSSRFFADSGKGYGELVALGLFCATSLHLIFMAPYIVILPDERTKLFSAGLCTLSLAAALALGSRKSWSLKSVPGVVSLVLLSLIVLSGLFSSTPLSSSLRGFAIAAAGLGGFWCARILLGSEERQRLFQWLCIFGLAGMIALVFLSLALGKPFYALIDSHWHPVVSRVILLSFAPLALLGSGSPRLVGLGVGLLILGYGVLLLGGRIGMESAVGIPAAMCLLAALLREWKWKHLGPILAGMLAISTIIGSHLIHQPGNVGKEHISIAYRAENIFFSWKIAKMHPFLGLGLWAPRDELVENYTPRYSHVSKNRFVKWTKELRTSENTILTFLADLGIPFVIIYGIAIAVLMIMLLRMVFRPPAGSYFHPLVLFLPLSGAVLHFQVVDGLFHPQVSWFFHVLLGLIPTSASLSPKPAISIPGVIGRALAFATAAALGIGIAYLMPPSIAAMF